MALPDVDDPTRHLHGKDPSDRPGEVAYPLLCHLLDTLVVADLLWSTRVRSGLLERIAQATVSGDGAPSLGVTAARAGLLYAAALHDIGKINPFFQFQERHVHPADWVPGLSSALGLAGSPRYVQEQLRQGANHALRRHEFISHRALSGKWAAARDQIAASDWVAVIAGGHHGFWRCMDPSDGGLGDILIGAGWSEQQKSLLSLVDETVAQITGVKRDEIPQLIGRDAAMVAVCLTGLVTQADWIASDDMQVEYGKQMFLGGVGPHGSVDAAQGWIEARRGPLRDHVDASLGLPLDVESKSLVDLIMGERSPRPLQQQAAALSAPGDDAGLWVAMYPTGDGKTEAAGLRHALDPSEGLIFGLPTRATTDAMESRVAQWYAALGVPVIKSHQFAEVAARVPSDSDNEGGGCGSASWYTTALRKLASPNVVATCDQVLAGALSNRHIAMRLFNLANHHVVLDEVHTYDTYQTELLVELLHWWGATGTRVTLLSATLPRAHMLRMVTAYREGAGALRVAPDDIPETEFPGSLYVPADPGQPMAALAPPPGSARALPSVTLDVDFTRDRAERVDSHVDWASTVVANHPDSPVAVVSNTVADCVDIAARLAADPKVTRTHDVLCLHSSMVAVHRTLRERELLAAIGKAAHEAGFDHRDPERRPVVVVGTQVIQASLDIDVDFLATDLAPAPDLIQRLGRQWRFVTDATDVSEDRQRRTGGISRTCRLAAVTLEDERTVSNSVPYLASTLQNTLTWLLRRPSAVVDVVGDSQTWVDQAYDRRLMAELADVDTGTLFALDRVAEDAMHVMEASNTKAVIAPDKPGTKGLLRNPAKGWGRSRTATWQDLADLSSRDVDEARMRTRYIDYESLSILLFDEDQIIGPLGLDDEGREVRIPRMPEALEELAPGQMSDIRNMSVSVNARVSDMIETAARATLGKEASWLSAHWDPKAKLIASTLPVDIKHLPDATYSPLTGLTFS